MASVKEASTDDNTGPSPHRDKEHEPTPTSLSASASNVPDPVAPQAEPATLEATEAEESVQATDTNEKETNPIAGDASALFGGTGDGDPFLGDVPALSTAFHSQAADASAASLFEHSSMQGASHDFFDNLGQQYPPSSQVPMTAHNDASAASIFQHSQTTDNFFDNLSQQPQEGQETQELHSNAMGSHQGYDPHALANTDPHHMESYQSQDYMQQQYEYDPNQWQQFDPNVHYYYDEQGLLHYYDPNTNQEYDMSQYYSQYQTQDQYDPQQYTDYYASQGYDPYGQQQHQQLQQQPLDDPSMMYGNNDMQQPSYDPYAPNAAQPPESLAPVEPAFTQQQQPVQQDLAQQQPVPQQADTSSHLASESAYDPFAQSEVYPAAATEGVSAPADEPSEQQMASYQGYEPLALSSQGQEQNFVEVQQHQSLASDGQYQANQPDQLDDILYPKETETELLQPSAGSEQLEPSKEQGLTDVQQPNAQTAQTEDLAETKGTEQPQPPQETRLADQNHTHREVSRDTKQAGEEEMHHALGKNAAPVTAPDASQSDYVAQLLAQDSLHQPESGMVDLQTSYLPDADQASSQQFEQEFLTSMYQPQTTKETGDAGTNEAQLVYPEHVASDEQAEYAPYGPTTQGYSPHYGEQSDYTHAYGLQQQNEPLTQYQPQEQDHYHQDYSAMYQPHNDYGATYQPQDQAQNDYGATYQPETQHEISDVSNMYQPQDQAQNDFTSVYQPLQQTEAHDDFPVTQHPPQEPGYGHDVNAVTNLMQNEQIATFEASYMPDTMQQPEPEPRRSIDRGVMTTEESVAALRYAPADRSTTAPERQPTPSLAPPPVERVMTPITQRLASPQPEMLYPCPDQLCEGENKAKAKFCCECGRPLGSFSRSSTPATALSPPPAAPYSSYTPISTATGMYAPANDTSLTANGAAPNLYAGQTSSYYQDNSQYSAGYGTAAASFYGNQPATVPATMEETGAYGAQEPGVMDQQGVSNDMYSAADVSAAPPDPLQRGKGCPLVSFGFGGKLCVMFPQTVQRFTNTSYEQRAPITKRMPSVIQIKSLKSVLGDQHTALSSLSEFVGPVLMDSKMNVKSKKKEVIAYMHKRIEEFNVTLSTLAEGSHEHTHMKNKMLLWKLVQTLIENEGHIGDGSAMDNAIRGLLQLPAVTEDEQNTFSVPAYAQELPSTENDDDRSTFILDKLQRLLLNGDRDGAVEYAMQEDLWAHALILSSCINKDLWKTVVTGFIERELAVTPEVKQSRVYQHVLGDKQSLRVLYSLFAGSGAAAVSELTRNQPLQRPNTPYGAATAAPVIDPDQLSHWTETLGLILANRTARDAEAITAIGDLLKTAGWIEAAHFCYLLSPQTSVHSGIDAVNVRLTLIGAQGPHAYTQLDALYLTELYEFALATKQSSPVPLPFLQGYKFAHALWLADMGCVGEAQRYCEAIANGIKTYTKGSPYLHQHLVEKLKEFAQLCEMASGNSFGADAGGWLKAKISKGSLDSLWGSLEGKFNKFVSGEDDVPAAEVPGRKSTEIIARPYDALAEGVPTRSMSAFDFRNGRSSVGPEAMRRAATPTASMASEGYYPKPFTPLSGYGPTGSDAVVPTQNAYAETQESAYQPSYGQGYQYGYNGDLSSNQNYTDDTTAAAAPADTAAAAPPRGIQSPFQQQGPPLTTSQSAYGYFNGAGQVHQADTHGTWQSHAEQSHIDPSGQETETTTSYQPSSYEPSTTANTSFLDDEDDGLGLGNSSLRKTKPAAPSEDASKPTEDTTQADAKKEEAKKEAAPARKGWGLFSLFSRSSGDDKEEKKAVKANLGEESHFYYDEKEKRWVNKLADSQPAPAPPPPPPKAASTPTARALSPAAPPSMGQATAPPSGAGLPPPPGLARATTSPGLTNSPPTAVTPTFSTPPPSGGRRTGAGRKPMRSRYVDVFNQPPS